jgi:hypothetical protein
MVIEPRPTWKPDKKAERILFDTYWSSQGWNRERTTPPADFAYAKQAGYLFDPIKLSHDELIDRLLRLRSRIDAPVVAQAFSDSLTTRRLDLRSALGSLGAALRLTKHGFESSRTSSSSQCNICKVYAGSEAEDLNVLSFERFKWGGVRHENPFYALFDLSQFEAANRDSRRQSREPLLRILDTAANASADCRPNDLVKLIASFVPGNTDQRRVVINCLGYAGILQPASHPGFFDGYPTYREHPGGKNDWSYPVSWWRGQDGVNSKALAFYFPDLKV